MYVGKEKIQMCNKIFTFWEPKNSLPAYLKLCLRTWEKFLPEYEVIVLDYSNLFEYIEKDTFSEYFFKNFSFPKQSDAIRCAVLKLHGGIWMDIDTIITSDKINNLIKTDSDFTTVGEHIAFVKAKKESEILGNWFNNVQKNIASHEEFYKNYNKSFLNKFFKSKERKFFERWDYLGNFALGRLYKTENTKKYFQIDKTKEKILPELVWAEENNIKKKCKKIYLDFYFNNDFSDYILKDNGGIICLHNSWTPLKYKKHKEEEFLKFNNTLSNIFKKIL